MTPLVPSQLPDLGPQRVSILHHHIWPVVSVDVTKDRVPFVPSDYVVRVINIAHQTSVLIPFDRAGLEKLQAAFAAALASAD